MPDAPDSAGLLTEVCGPGDAGAAPTRKPRPQADTLCRRPILKPSGISSLAPRVPVSAICGSARRITGVATRTGMVATSSIGGGASPPQAAATRRTATAANSIGRTFTWKSFLITSVAFCFEHQPADWPAALLTGALFNLVAYRTKSLAACVLTHAVTNLALAIYVLQTRQWGFW